MDSVWFISVAQPSIGPGMEQTSAMLAECRGAWMVNGWRCACPVSHLDYRSWSTGLRCVLHLIPLLLGGHSVTSGSSMPSPPLLACCEHAYSGRAGAGLQTCTRHFQTYLMILLLCLFPRPPCSPMPFSRGPSPTLPLPLCSQRLPAGVCGSALGDRGGSGQPHEAALHLLHEEGGGGGHHGGGMVLQARGR